MSLHFIGFPTNARRRTYQIFNSVKTFYNFLLYTNKPPRANQCKKGTSMKARKFVLIYFKTVKATQSTQGKKKKNTARKKVNTGLMKKMNSHQNKEKHGRKTNLANSLGAGYASYFKAVFFVSCGSLWFRSGARYLTSEQFSLSRLVLVLVGCLHYSVLSYTLLNTLENFM